MLSVPVPVVQTAPPLDPHSPLSAWPASPAIALPWNVAHSDKAQEPTTVHIATDGKYIYVRFDAVQHEPVVANQHSNDLIAGGSNFGGGLAWSDDSVWVDLWPTGPGGFQYQFESNAIGAHNEASSENASFAPSWESRGAENSDGYTVTMAIPLAVVHGAHAGTWEMQFARYVRSTGALDIWSYDTAQSNPDDSAHAGSVNVPLVARAPLPKPRLSVYGLGALDSKSIGGSTSRTGADFSIPVTQTAAFYGTFHPDYSNVELDQQSISPTVYQRTYSEVRPFFTQASGYYNNFNCDVCNGFRTILYTPAIPTPRSGYAFEGRQGNFGLAAFDSIGVGRNDSASALDFTSNDSHWNASLEHVTTDLPGLVDDANELGIAWFNGKYLSAYANVANDRGTAVTDRSQGNWIDAGGGWGSQHFAIFGSVRKVGSQFNPADGFDSHPGIAGYGIYSARVWTFSPKDALASAGVDVFLDRYQGVTGGIAQADQVVLLDVLTKSAIDLQLSSGSDYWRFGNLLTPISQNGGVSLTFHSGMQNNLNNFPTHGSSSTPTSIQFVTGRYGDGRLDTWFRNSTMRAGMRGYLTLTVDNTAQWMPHSPANIQWFDGLSYAYQVGPNSSFAVGLRRVIGYPPLPNGGGDCEGVCSNVSLAYHLRTRNEEFYLAYGDPNSLSTVPQAIFKIIFYAGGEKGT
jgi:hypothetical protein